MRIEGILGRRNSDSWLSDEHIGVFVAEISACWWLCVDVTSLLTTCMTRYIWYESQAIIRGNRQRRLMGDVLYEHALL